jgi:hypothetical protein
MDMLFAVISVFILNLPFGYWRANVKKFSLQWALAIHIPVPFVVAIRFYSHIGFELYTYPILVAAFFTSQFLGAKIYSNRKENSSKYLSSCLVMDLIRGGIN